MDLEQIHLAAETGNLGEFVSLVSYGRELLRHPDKAHPPFYLNILILFRTE